MCKKATKAVKEMEFMGDRALMVKLSLNPVNLNVVVVYANFSS